MARGMQVTQRDIDDARREIQKIREKQRDSARQRRDASDQWMNRGIRLLSVASGATAAAALQARFGITGIGPFPIDAVAGLATVAAGIYTPGVLGDVLVGMGEGAVAAAATKFGANLGAQWRQSMAPTTPSPATFTAGVGNAGWGMNPAMPPMAFGNGAVCPPMPYAAPGYDPYASVPVQAQGWGGTDAQVLDIFRRGAMG